MLMDKLRKHHAETYYHSLRVSQLCFQVASYAGMEYEVCLMAVRAGLLHDIGKLFVPSQILSKNGRLTKGEYEKVKSHVIDGVAELKGYQYKPTIIEAVLGHHEREDGSGYPNSIANISELARVVAVCDVFDAMTETRVYKSAQDKNIVLDKMIKGELGAFQMKFVGILKQVVSSNPIAQHRNG
jgi:putative nucleotidyltransferase with HDIG domain